MFVVGQSSTTPFGAHSVFGQSNNANNNPSMHEPFSSTSPIISQTGSSIFGGTSTSVFGATQSSSHLASSPAIGASSIPAYGSSVSAFGVSATPDFGSSSSSFGGSFVFGQKPAFGGFESASSQTRPFGSTVRQTQSAYGSNVFGSSTPFGATSQPAFGSASTSAFKLTGTPAFGSTSAPAFGATQAPAFGSSSTSAFGNTGSSLAVSNAPAFGSGVAFGTASTPICGSSTTSTFGASSVLEFGAIGASSSPSFNFGCSPSLAQSHSAFGSSPFGRPASPFGAQSCSFENQTATSTSTVFGKSSFGGQRRGSTVTGFIPTAEVYGGSSTQPAGKLESISTMPAYEDKSHEEFRLEDYQLGDKGRPNAVVQCVVGFGTPAVQSKPFGASPTIGQTSTNVGSQVAKSTFDSTVFGKSSFGVRHGGSRVASYIPTAEVYGSSRTQLAGKLVSISAMPAYEDKSHEELRLKDYQLGDKGGSSAAVQFAVGFGKPVVQSRASRSIGQTSMNPFPSTEPINPSISKTSTFGPSLFGPSNPTFTSSPFSSPLAANSFGTSSSPIASIFSATYGPAGASSSPSLLGSQNSTAVSSSPLLVGSSAPGMTSAFTFNNGNFQSDSLFQPTTPSFAQTNSSFGQTNSTSGRSTPIGESNCFTHSLGLGSSNSATLSLLATNQFSTPFQAAQPAQASSALSFNNFDQNQAPIGFDNFSCGFGQGTHEQSQTAAVGQPTPVSSPFGTLPAMPQISSFRSGSPPSVQYGISSMPVTDKANPARVSSLLTSRRLSQRRTSLPARKYHRSKDSPKVPFYCDDEEPPKTLKADALFVPRENPRELVLSPNEKLSLEACVQKPPPLLNSQGTVCQNGLAENGSDREHINLPKMNQIDKCVQEDHSPKKKTITPNGDRDGESALGADIETIVPKLKHADYYTEPQIQELASKERTEPGYCQHVKDFVVGRHGYGSIKFIGETDVRGLDLESLVQLSNWEVVVYMDDSKKPPVGQGLNKLAEVTLLNVKCYDKKTGQQYTEGPRVEKYEKMLVKAATDQGAEFLSYDALKGEWRFRVNHFN